jgi:hypothetical protein
MVDDSIGIDSICESWECEGFDGGISAHWNSKGIGIVIACLEASLERWLN